MSETTELRKVLDEYASPSPSIVLKIPGRGFSPDYVGHADATRTLIEIDPGWCWEPQAWAPDGGPVITERNGQLIMWGFLTLLGKRMPCVGTCEANKKEADKELIGDLIRNGAMRFGIFINLWSKADHDAAKNPPPEPEPEAAPPWDEPRWAGLGERLRALPDEPKAKSLAMLEREGLFTGRTPNKPFTSDQLNLIEKIINDRTPAAPALAADAEAVTAPAQRPQHAIDTLADARDCDPLTAEGIEEWMWELASHANPDEIPWKSYTGKDRTGLRQTLILDKARELASDLTVKGITTDVPDRLDDIHGELAVALRLALLAYDPSQPF